MAAEVMNNFTQALGKGKFLKDGKQMGKGH
jgi:hypothetical protein